MKAETKRLCITELNMDMADKIHLNSLDEDNRRFIPDEVFESVKDAKKALSSLISFYSRNDSPLVYAVILENTQELIGHVQAVPIKEGWEIGYHIAKDFSGKGYATEAVQAFLPVIMKKLGITEIYGVCHAENIASRKVLEKCRFLLEYEGLGQYQGVEQSICQYKYSAASKVL